MLKIAFNDNYIYPLDENHRFPMIKYELIPEQLIRENTCTNDNFFKPNIGVCILYGPTNFIAYYFLA